MIKRDRHFNITWIQLSNPSESEIADISDEFLLSQSVREEIKTPSLSAKFDIDNGNDSAFVILHFPAIDSKVKGGRKEEIDFILSKRWLITITYDDTLQFFDTSEVVNKVYSENTKEDVTAAHIAMKVVRRKYKACNKDLDIVDEKLLKVENQIFNGNERKMVNNISEIIHKLMDFDHSLTRHHRVMQNFKDYCIEHYGNYTADEFRKRDEIYDDVYGRIRSLRDAIDEFKDTNDSLLQHKTNDTMKTLTMMSFVIFPLSLIAGVFGMDTHYTPILGRPHDFAIIISIMFGATAAMFIYFKYKKWL